MWIEHENGQDLVVTWKMIDGKNVKMLVPLAQYEREQEAIHMAKEKRAVEEKAAKERQAAEKEQQRRAAKLTAIPPLEAILILARRGQKAILPQLRQVLNEHPELVSHYGSLTLQVQESWLQLIAGKNLLLVETMRRHLDEMRMELAGPNLSPLDCLLVERIVATHVQSLYFEGMETTDPTAENTRVNALSHGPARSGPQAIPRRSEDVGHGAELGGANERHPGRVSPPADGPFASSAHRAQRQRRTAAVQRGDERF